MDNKELVKQFEYLARSLYSITFLATNACLSEQKLNAYGIKSMSGTLSNLMYVLRDYLPYKSNDFKELFKELNSKQILGDYPYYFSSLIDKIEKETINIDRFLGGIEREIEKGDYNIDRFELDVASEDLSDYWSFGFIMSSYGIDKDRYDYEIFNDDTVKDKPALKEVQLSYLEVGEKLESNALTLKEFFEYITKDFPKISKVKDPKIVSKVIEREEEYKSIISRDGYYYKHPEQYGKQVKTKIKEETEDIMVNKGGRMELKEELKKVSAMYTELLALGYVMTLSDNKDRSKLSKEYCEYITNGYENLIYSSKDIWTKKETINEVMPDKTDNPYFNVEFVRKIGSSQEADIAFEKIIKNVEKQLQVIRLNLRYMKDTMERNGRPIIDYYDMEDTLDDLLKYWKDKEMFQFGYYAWKSKSGIELGFDGYNNVFYADKFLTELKTGKSLYKIFKEANRRRIEVEQFSKDLWKGKYLPCVTVKVKNMYICSEEFIRDNADELIRNPNKYAKDLDQIIFIPSLTREISTPEDLAEAFRVGISDKDYGNFIKNILLQMYSKRNINDDINNYFPEDKVKKILQAIKNNTKGVRITQSVADKISDELAPLFKRK